MTTPAFSHEDAFAAFYALRLRTPQLGAKLVWIYVAPLLDPHVDRPLSGCAIAKVLDTKLPTVRRALQALHEWGLVECTEPPGPRWPGWYRLGAEGRRLLASGGRATPPPYGA